MRMNNDEFKGLIPYLQLDDIFLIEIKKLGEWKPMFESVIINSEEYIRCNQCEGHPNIKLFEFDTHLKCYGHSRSYDNVDQFYHPVYTFSKVREDWSFNRRGEELNIQNESEKNRAKHLSSLVREYIEQKILYLSLNDIMDITCYSEEKKFPLISDGQKTASVCCVLCNHVIISDINEHFRCPRHLKRVSTLKALSLINNPKVDKHVLIQMASDAKTLKFDELLIDMLLREKPPAPHAMDLVFEMPIEDLYKTEYLVGNSWRHMVTKLPNEPSHVKCLLCNIVCTRANLNDHLNGKQHKKNQLDVKVLRNKNIQNATKYAVFTVSSKHNIKISLKARRKLRHEVENELTKLVAGHQSGLITFGAVKRREEVEKEDADVSKMDEHSFKIDGTERSASATGSNALSALPPAARSEASVLPKKAKVNINADDALVGVEYVVKILEKEDDPNPMYECCLCEVLTDEYSMQEHLTGYDHRYKYCELHYSGAFKKYMSLISGLRRQDMYRVMNPILARIALGIEEYHGRGLARIVDADNFANNRPEIIAQLYSGKHACQLYGPSYTNLFTDEEIRKLKLEKDFFKSPAKIPKDIPRRFTVYSYGQQYCNAKVRQEKLTSNASLNKSKTKERPKEFDKAKRLSKSSPISSVGISKSDQCDQYKRSKETLWKRYQQQMFVSKYEIERAYDEYRNNPESHPLYDQEWNAFWRRRKAELNAIGVDHRAYNFQPEWVNYFKNRIEELFAESLKQTDFDVRKRLDIPLNAKCHGSSGNNFTEKQLFENVEISSSHSALRVGSEKPPESQYESVLPKMYVHAETPVPPPQKRQKMDTDSLVKQWNSQGVKPVARGERKGSERGEEEMELHSNADKSFDSKGKTENEKPDVRHVLRLLAALEDHLGSLGPKITELLYISLSLDKSIYNNSSLLEQKMLTPNNCSLLETAMEKLKGIVYAGLLEDNKKSGFNQVIKCTQALLNYAEKLGCRNSLINEETQQKEFNTRNQENFFKKPLSIISAKNENIYTQTPFQHVGNSPPNLIITSETQNEVSKNPFGDNIVDSYQLKEPSMFSQIMETKNKPIERFRSEMNDLNLATVGGINSNNMNLNNNNNNNYRQFNQSINMSNRRNDFEGFNADNWGNGFGNSQQAFVSNTIGNQLSQLQKQNLKQLQLLRHQQQQRQRRQD